MRLKPPAKRKLPGSWLKLPGEERDLQLAVTAAVTAAAAAVVTPAREVLRTLAAAVTLTLKTIFAFAGTVVAVKEVMATMAVMAVAAAAVWEAAAAMRAVTTLEVLIPVTKSAPGADASPLTLLAPLLPRSVARLPLLLLLLFLLSRETVHLSSCSVTRTSTCGNLDLPNIRWVFIGKAIFITSSSSTITRRIVGGFLIAPSSRSSMQS